MESTPRRYKVLSTIRYFLETWRNRRRSSRKRWVGVLCVCIYTIISPCHGSNVEIKKMCSSTNVSSQTNSSASLGKSDISSAKIKDFFDFAETKSRSNSCRMTVHCYIFPQSSYGWGKIETNWHGPQPRSGKGEYNVSTAKPHVW